jgi:hypothetical protein
VKLSCAIGGVLYPHHQWANLARVWEAMYPLARLTPERRELFRVLRATTPAFVEILVNHRPRALRGRALKEVMSIAERQPARLSEHFRRWRTAPALARSVSPTMAFAVIGQARADGAITPEGESQLLAQLLTFWALRSNLNVSVSAKSTMAGVAHTV